MLDKCKWKKDKVGGGKVLDLALKVKNDEYKGEYRLWEKEEEKDG